MTKNTFFSLFLLTTTFLLHSQNLKTISIKECDETKITLNTCANYNSARYDFATIVVNTNLNIKFEVLNAKCNLTWVFREEEKNRYFLCVEPMGALYNEYEVVISGKEIFTKTFTIKDLKSGDKRFYCIKEVPELVSNEKQFTEEQKIKETLPVPITSTTSVLINGVRWATCNVNTPGTFTSTPSEAGMFYQWNSNIGWSNTDPMFNSKGGTKWVTSNTFKNKWEKTNDPCPNGWRVPTKEELMSLINSGRTFGKLEGVSGIFLGKGENQVFFPNAGYRFSKNGELYNTSTYGYYWSNTPHGSGEYAFNLSSKTGSVSNYSAQGHGFSLRCVKE